MKKKILFLFLVFISFISRAQVIYSNKPLGVQLNRSKTTASGIVAYWPFNEGGGAILTDIAGKGTNNGTLTNFSLSGATSDWYPSVNGGGLNFDGVNDQIAIGSVPAIDLTANMTVVAWVNISVSNTSVQVVIMNATSTGGNQNYGMEVNRTTAGHFDALWGNAVIGINNTAMSVGKVYQIAWTRSGSSGSWNCTFYLNGVQDGTLSTATNPDGGARVTRIGAYPTAAGSNFFNGYMFDLRLYNRVLSQNEIRRLYVNPHDDLIK